MRERCRRVTLNCEEHLIYLTTNSHALLNQTMHISHCEYRAPEIQLRAFHNVRKYISCGSIADLYVISLALVGSILRSLVMTPTFIPARLNIDCSQSPIFPWDFRDSYCRLFVCKSERNLGRH